MGLRDRYLERRGEQEGPPSLWEQAKDTFNPATWGPGLLRFGGGVASDLRQLGETAVTLPSLAAAKASGMDSDELARRGEWIAQNPVLRQFIAEETYAPVEHGDPGNWRSEFAARGHQLIPTLTGVGASVESTPGRVVQQAASLAPGGLAPTDTEYAQASREGRIVPLVLEDVGNVALVGGAAAQGLGRSGQVVSRVAPGLEPAANRLSQVGRTVERVADTADQLSDPSRVWGAPSRLGGAALRRVGEATGNTRLAEVGGTLNTAGVVRPLWRGATARHPGLLGPADRLMISRRTRPLHQALAANDRELDVQQVQSIRPLADTADRVGKAEQGAAMLLDMGQLEVLDPALSRFGDLADTPEVHAQLADTLRSATSMDVTGEQVGLARGYLSGTLDDATRARIDEARGVYDTAVRAPLTGRYLSGVDDPRPLDPAQVEHRVEATEGTGYLSLARRNTEAEYDSRIAEAQAKVDGLKETIAKLDESSEYGAAKGVVARTDLERATRRVTRLTKGRESAVEKALAADPNAAPARYRPAILASRKVADDLLAEAARLEDIDPTSAAMLLEAAEAIPTDLEGIVAAGIEPKYVAGGRVLENTVDLSVEVPEGLGEALGVDDPRAVLGAAARVRDLESKRPMVADDPAGLAQLEDALVEPRAVLAEHGVVSLDQLEERTRGWMRDTGNGYIHIDRGRSVEAPERVAPGGQLTYRARPETPRGATLSQSKLKESGATPVTFDGQAKLVATRIAQAARNREQRWMVDNVALTVDDLGLVEVAGEDAVNAANQIARERFGYGVKAFNTNPEKLGAFDEVPASAVTVDALESGEIVFVPEFAWDAYRTRWGQPGTWERFAEATLDKPMDWFKMGALAFNPRWQLGNAVGGMIMSTFAAGLGPVEIMRQAKRGMELARKADRTPWELSDVEQRMFTSHPERESAAFAREGRTPSEQPQGRLRSVADRSYHLNEMIDNFYKSTVYNAQRARGYSDAHAVELALKALPDFRNRQWENRVMKRILPFWPWMREVTKISYRLGRDHPLRVAWAMRIGDMYASQTETDEIDWLQGALQTGDDRFLMLGTLNPFSDIPALSPLDVGRNLNPMLKLGAAAFTGIDLSDNRYLTRPPGTGGTTALGAESGRPLLTDWSGLAYYTAGIVPQTRALRDAVLEPVERYESGDPIRPAERIPGTNRYRRDEVPSEGRLSSVWRLTGLPLPTEVDVDEMLRIKRERDAQRRRVRSAYEG